MHRTGKNYLVKKMPIVQRLRNPGIVLGQTGAVLTSIRFWVTYSSSVFCKMKLVSQFERIK